MSRIDHGTRQRLLRLGGGFLAVVTLTASGYLVATRESDPSGATGDPGGATTTAPVEPAPPTTGTTTASVPSPSTTAPTTTTPVTPTTTPTGRFTSAPGTGPVHGSGPVRTYRAEVEDGTGVDPAAFAAIIDGILADRRGWTADGGVAFQRVSDGSASFVITLATPPTTDEICLPLRTNGRYSCREGDRAVLNLRRWNEGTAELPFAIDDYRAHVVNHEVGHVLGRGHVGCGSPGTAAPVMMQQSKGLGGCRANAWPALDGS